MELRKAAGDAKVLHSALNPNRNVEPRFCERSFSFAPRASTPSPTPCLTLERPPQAAFEVTLLHALYVAPMRQYALYSNTSSPSAPSRLRIKDPKNSHYALKNGTRTAVCLLKMLMLCGTRAVQNRVLLFDSANDTLQLGCGQKISTFWN